MLTMVVKFGGTSMADLACIDNAASIVQSIQTQGYHVVVVVSAMAGETDRLISLAKRIRPEICDREYSMLVSTGEQVSVALMAMALQAHGCNAISLTGRQAGILTEQSLKKARIKHVDADPIKEHLTSGKTVVVTGFQGCSLTGDISTLGRGGSDTSAVAIAAALKADECRIYTDVDGVYTTDPRVEPRARRLDRVTFEEMLEMASLGAKVLQIRSVEYAGKHAVPLRVLSSFSPDEGTLITYEEKSVESAVVSAIAFNRTEAKVSVLGVPDQPGIAGMILSRISQAGIDIDMIIQNLAEQGHTDFTFTVHRDDYVDTMTILNNIVEDLSAQRVEGDTRIAKLSLIGVGMRSHAGIATKMFECLAEEGINIQLISTSEIKISVIIDEKYLELGVRALHAAFNLHQPTTEEFDPKTS